MKSFLLSLVLFASVSFKPAGNVFICISKGSKAYHSSKTCSGIKRCTHEVREVTLNDAKNNYGRVACKICY